MDVLKEVTKGIAELDELRKQGMRADTNEVSRVMGNLADLASKFYQLIPQKEGENETVKPMKNTQELQQQYVKLDQLVNIEFTSRMLLAALYRQYTLNPMQYIYASMGVRITPLEEGDPECDLIRAYCLNTASSPANGGVGVKRIKIFKIERKGEPERFEKVAAEVGNRKLLFHGSGISNFLGLLA